MGVERENIILFGVKDEYNKSTGLNNFNTTASIIIYREEVAY